MFLRIGGLGKLASFWLNRQYHKLVSFKRVPQQPAHVNKEQAKKCFGIGHGILRAMGLTYCSFLRQVFCKTKFVGSRKAVRVFDVSGSIQTCVLSHLTLGTCGSRLPNGMLQGKLAQAIMEIAFI